jgi:hypothetical protein
VERKDRPGGDPALPRRVSAQQSEDETEGREVSRTAHGDLSGLKAVTAGEVREPPLQKKTDPRLRAIVVPGCGGLEETDFRSEGRRRQIDTFTQMNIFCSGRRTNIYLTMRGKRGILSMPMLTNFLLLR